VARHQRARLRAAMTELVYEHGYAKVGVRDLIKRAHVSKPTFYKLFEGKEDCFVRTYDEVATAAVQWVSTSTAACTEVEALATRGVDTFSIALAERPQAATLALLEPLSVGQVARRRMRQTEVEFARLTRDRFREAGGYQLPPAVVLGIVAGMARNARLKLERKEADRFRRAAPELTRWLLATADPAVIGIEAEGLMDWSPVAPTEAGVDRIDGTGDRDLLLKATARLVAREGYAALTPASIAALAGVPRTAFAANFESVEDCFAQTVEIGASAAITKARIAYESAEEWSAGVVDAIAIFCDYFSREPEMARLVFIEVFAPGRGVARQGTGVLSGLAELLASGAKLPSETSAEASVGAIWGLLRRSVGAGRGARLRELAPVLSWFALAPTIGPAQARALLSDGDTGSAVS
jgi:AcrR family transcriptional regulator